jgi:RimJ/RimL family protein N-acetyltransferase
MTPRTPRQLPQPDPKEALRSNGALPLRGATVTLAEFCPGEVGPEYLAWMNDPETTRYLESRFQVHTLESLRDFVQAAYVDEGTWFFRILESASGRHVGNIKIGPRHGWHQRAEVGIVIGEKSCRGQGMAAQAIRLVADFAFRRLAVHKLVAGMYEANKGSLRAFQKAGFQLEGILTGHCFCEGAFTDQYMVGLTLEQWRAHGGMNT